MPLFPLDPPSSLYPLFWGWLSLCVKLCRGVITAPLEKGGGLLEQKPGRCGCLNWPTSTESQQPDNYATTQNPFPWRKGEKTALTGSLHPFTLLERALPTMIRCVVLASHLHFAFRPLCGAFIWSFWLERNKTRIPCRNKQKKMKSGLEGCKCV